MVMIAQAIIADTICELALKSKNQVTHIALEKS